MAQIAEWARNTSDAAFNLVSGAMDESLGRVYATYQTAVDTIGKLGQIDLDFPADVYLQKPPWIDNIWIAKPDLGAVPNIEAVPNINDPGISLTDPGAPEPIGDIPEYVDPGVVFTPLVPPPAPDYGVPPDKLILDDSGLVMPPDPVLVYPTLDPLTIISIPSFTAPPIPGFTDAAPGFTWADPNTTGNWSESNYNPDLLDEVKAVILRLMDGNAIPAAVEDAMWQRARAREDVVLQKAMGDAFNDWAGKGFTMPPGMLVEQVNVARQDAVLKTNTMSRDVAIKHAEWMQENVKFSVVQGLAYEQVLINLWENAVKRMFEMQKLTVELGLKLYEVQVTIYNATMQAYKIKADVWKTRIEAVAQEVAIYKARVDAEIAKGQINEQYVKVYVAKMDALKSMVEVYKAQVSAVQVKADVLKTRVMVYAEEVKAYSVYLEAQKIPFEIFDSQVKGEVSKATLLETRVKEFVARVQAFDTVEQTKMKKYTADVQALGLKVDVYKAKLSAEQMKVEAAVAKNEVRIKAYAATIDKYRADTTINVESQKLYTSVFADRVRTDIAFLDAQIKQWVAKSEVLIKKADLQSRAMQAAAQNSTGLSNAAMSAIHYTAGFSGTSQLSASEQKTGVAA